MNIGVHMSFRMIAFSGYMPSSGIVWSHGRFIPSFLKESPYILHNGCISLHFCHQYSRVLFSPRPLQHLLFVDFFDDGHSDWCEVKLHYSSHLHFSNNES